ncbi:MAG: hypothetical protein P8L85_11110 [Rubripirellula sp.]|nr:hypothetical protein [Rubripirellula sp.]
MMRRTLGGAVSGCLTARLVMNEFLLLLSLMLIWFLLNAWVLPKFGIKT